MIIDIHGHYTTYPPGVEAYRGAQIAQMSAPARGKMNVTDDEIRRSIENGQLKVQQRARHRPDSVFATRQLDGPPLRQRADQPLLDRAHQRPRLSRPGDVSRTTSSVCARCPSRPAPSPANCIAELERCVNELGFVGCNLSPDTVRRLLAGTAADRPLLVPDVRKARRARRASHGPRQRHVQPGVPPDRFALSERRYHHVHAVRAATASCSKTSPRCG